MKINLTMVPIQNLILVAVIVAIGADLGLALTTKADCQELWKIFGGHGSVHDSFRKMSTNGGMKVNKIVSLYQDCLRAEEGIRYRRSGQDLLFSNGGVGTGSGSGLTDRDPQKSPSLSSSKTSSATTMFDSGATSEPELSNAGRRFLLERLRLPSLLASLLNRKEPKPLYSSILSPQTTNEQLLPEVEK